MAIDLKTDALVDHLTKAIHNMVRTSVDLAVEEAVKDVERKIRKEVDYIALHVLSYYSMECFGENLVITVKKGGE